MTININRITVRGLGPVRQFDHALGKINMIYGHNERGKTMLVEFIIRSLFKYTKNWPLRDIIGEGGVTVSGLGDEAVQIKPKTPKKLEDYWELSHADFPQDMSKLLVVRAAEVELSDKDVCGIDKQILLEYLSGKGVIDAIQDKVAGALRNASLKDGVIIGAREMGIKKNLTSTDEDIARVAGKYERVNKEYSQGKLQDLRGTEAILVKKADQLTRAKRHAAFTCYREAQSIRGQIERYPQDTLDAVGESIVKLSAKQQDLERSERGFAEAKKQGKHYEWLKHAIDLYEKRESLALPKYNLIWLVLGGVCLLSFAILMGMYGYSFAAQPWLWALLAGAALGAAVYIINQNKLLRNRDAFEDVNDIKAAYKEKFGTALSGLSALKAAQEETSAAYFSAKNLKESIERTKKEMVEIQTDLTNYLLTLSGEKAAVAALEQKYAQIKDRKQALQDNLTKLTTRLEVLDVAVDDYLEEAPETPYSKEALEETDMMLAHARAQIIEEDSKMMTLKQALCDETGHSVQDNWDVILDALREKLNSLYESHKAIKADIIAQILVNQSLDVYREQEDEKIREGLASKKLVEALEQVTGKYNKIELVGDGLVVSDRFSDFPFSDLSTGTQEQIFLALRIGFASKISKNENLFFILDDAFQYSDWDRRELLVDKMIDLAKHDWQVIYFSMDDHIRDLFIKKAGKAFKDEFKLINMDKK